MTKKSNKTAVTVFSEPEQEKILRTFTDTFQLHLRGKERFSLRSGVDEEKVVVRLELADDDRDEVLVMECAADVELKQLQMILKVRTKLIEFLYAMLDTYFKGDRWPRPNLDWKEFQFDGETILYRGSVTAERLEGLADKLLAGASPSSLGLK